MSKYLPAAVLLALTLGCPTYVYTHGAAHEIQEFTPEEVERQPLTVCPSEAGFLVQAAYGVCPAPGMVTVQAKKALHITQEFYSSFGDDFTKDKAQVLEFPPLWRLIYTTDPINCTGVLANGCTDSANFTCVIVVRPFNANPEYTTRHELTHVLQGELGLGASRIVNHSDATLWDRVRAGF